MNDFNWVTLCKKENREENNIREIDNYKSFLTKNLTECLITLEKKKWGKLAFH